MASKMTLDTSEFEQAILETFREVRTQMSTAFRWQMALWCADIIKKLGPNKFQLKSLSKQKSKIEFNISQDVQDVFNVIPDNAIRWHDPKKHEFGFRKPGTRNAFFVPVSHFLALGSFAQIEKIHNENRIEGHVKNPVPLKSRFAVMQKNLADYLKEKQTHVGRGKSVWVTCYNFFNSDKLAKFNVPEWITRHSTFTAGQAAYSFSESSTGPINIVAKASSGLAWGDDPQGVVDTVGRTRFFDLMRAGKGGAKWRLEEILKAHSAKGVA